MLGEWVVNKIFPLTGGQGSLYLQLQYVPDGGEFNKKNPALLKDLEEESRLAQIERDTPIKGSLVVNVVLGRNLRDVDAGKSDKSDPYVEILLPGGVKAASKPVSDCLNPIWDFKSSNNVNVTKGVRIYRNIFFLFFCYDSK
jgi:hypothetical protein